MAGGPCRWLRAYNFLITQMNLQMMMMMMRTPTQQIRAIEKPVLEVDHVVRLYKFE